MLMLNLTMVAIIMFTLHHYITLHHYNDALGDLNEEGRMSMSHRNSLHHLYYSSQVREMIIIYVDDQIYM